MRQLIPPDPARLEWMRRALSRMTRIGFVTDAEGNLRYFDAYVALSGVLAYEGDELRLVPAGAGPGTPTAAVKQSFGVNARLSAESEQYRHTSERS